jgi:proteasome lid subunit RPN8/RPN11
MHSMNTILVPSAIVSETLAILQKVGRRRSECVVLWLGKRGADSIRVEEVYKPDQVASRDFFRIPEESMEKLFQKLRTQRLFVAAQVHTHPNKAFHSYADDEWAIVRHTGALSLVIPYFAKKTRAATFGTDTVVFALSALNQWIEVGPGQISNHYRIIP